MTPREKLIEKMQSIIDGTAILTIDIDSGEPLLLNPDKIAEAIIDYLKLEVVDNETSSFEIALGEAMGVIQINIDNLGE